MERKAEIVGMVLREISPKQVQPPEISKVVEMI
jgi:hypothetical protein